MPGSGMPDAPRSGKVMSRENLANPSGASKLSSPMARVHVPTAPIPSRSASDPTGRNVPLTKTGVEEAHGFGRSVRKGNRDPTTRRWSITKGMIGVGRDQTDSRPTRVGQIKADLPAIGGVITRATGWQRALPRSCRTLRT